MNILHEDIFNNDPLELILRYGKDTIKAFDKAKNKFPFEYLVQLLNNKEFSCYFLKQSNVEHKIIIPLIEQHGQLEIVATWHLTSTYEIKVNKKKKTKYHTSIELPDKQYRIDQICIIRLIGIEDYYDNFEALSELKKLKSKIDDLEIAPKTLIENQRDTWIKYVEALELLIRKLQEPFPCTGNYEISEIKNNKGEISRFKFKVELIVDSNDEYRMFEDELKKLDVEEKFNTDGTIFLKLDDIFRGLDSIIRKKFTEVFEREKNIGCILKIRPLSIVQKVQSEIPYGKVSKDNDNRQLLISNLTVRPIVIDPILRKNGFRLSKLSVDFKVKNIKNLYHSELNNRYSITFGKKFQKKDNEKEMLFPEPVNENTFRIIKPINEIIDSDLSTAINDPTKPFKPKESIEDIGIFRLTLNRIYGKDNVEMNNIVYIYEPIDKERVKFFEQSFSSEFWKDLKRELYLIGFDVSINEFDNTLYFEFNDRDDLIEKYTCLKELNKFEILKSPLDEDFKFKVKTNLIVKKTAKQIFQERLEKLRGVEFVYNKAKKDEKWPDFVFIGKLSAQESSINQLVFNIPFHYPDEKKRAKDFLNFIEKRPEIKSVQANLKGDEAKIKWLREAMEKLKEENQQSEKPNSKPINNKIRDFIFDSSKAEPVYKFDFTPIEETEEYKAFPKFEILKLNDSQRKSVLKALYAKDLCLLQGPPGTGKTTVIAELIWQHVRQDQRARILLTSETNLAVDNALEKLMNTNNSNPELAKYITLIKPIRFGKAEKFEEEGKKYSIERIQKWLDEKIVKELDYENEQLGIESDDEDEVIEDNPNINAIQQWMIRIADRSKASDEKYQDVLKEWVTELSKPSKETKQFFKDKYIKYVNVVGSTCSSTGSPAFLRDYQLIFTPNFTQDTYKKINELYFLINERPESKKIDSLINDLSLEIDNPTEDNFEPLKSALSNYLTIQFDTVIMDEASKATPPELLLPLCFGKKSIIIGDHRQLPPLLNEKDFKETLLDLNDTRATQLAEEIDREFVETSQFKRLILNPQVSHTIKSTFNVQYRMHPHINDVIKQFYLNDESGGLICGLDKDKVNDHNLADPQSRYHGFFHEGFINDNIHTIWVDVDEPEMQDGTSRINESEVEAIKRVLMYLKNSEGFEEYMKSWDTIKDEEKRIQEKEIGIISFYGKQVSKLRELRSLAKQLGIPIRLKTVDKFQGMERNIIIVSTVRSDKLDKGNNIIVSNSDIGFAKAPERLNVALSRARRLLIVVGNKNFFYKFKDKEGNPIYKNAIDEIAKNGKIIDYKTLNKYVKK